ncbi:hypothetical protein Vretimale_18950 [Volvox reticuliferus]|uniref:Uncharacterized protein n=1 Tax=Volvox reticuliferus TaxID=1737510 RepID=A0A8J4GZ08_9CHLO|nr:hypothetical protein Vretimale_18950 [Volvox reticuliferus]
MLKSSTLVDWSKTRRPSLKSISAPKCPFVLSKQRVLFPVQCPRQIHLRRVTLAAATPPRPASATPAADSDFKLKKGFWTFVDVVAILGSVGGALAAILNLFSGTYVLFLPLVLPVISLLSALQREGLIAEDNRRAYDTLRVSLTHDSNTLLAEARSAIEEVRRELRGQNTTAARLGTIEARLSSLEGSILSAGRSAREAAAGLGVLPERLQVEQRAVLEGLVAAMRVELRRAAESLANNETTALARLDSRLAAVEGSLSGLEVAQSEGLRRLSMSLNSALADAEATLQSSVRNEVARSMEPVRRLPQMLAAALPPALAAAEAVEASAAVGPAAVAGAVVGAGGAAAVGLTPEQLQAIVSQEVEVAVARILDFQVEAFGRLNTVRPVPIDEEQWGALGRRLTRLERLVEGVPAGTEGALLQGGQVPAAVAAAVGEALAAQVAEAQAEVMAAAAREAESVRNDVLAAQTVLRENLDSLAAALQPLQLGVMELQVAVSAVSTAQQQQQQQQQQLAQQDAVPGGTVGNVGAVAETLPSSGGELVRLLEGVEAVAQLLRDVDTKMDCMTAAMAQLPAAAAVPPSPAPMVVPTPDAAAEAIAAATAKQQHELQSGIEAMKEALAALTTQVGLIATQSQGVVRAAEPSAPAAAAASAVAYVLSFEASLASAAPPERNGGSDGGSLASTVGATRDEAYDMMLQLAEARRRSGSEASPSGAIRNDVASGVNGSGVSGAVAAGPSASSSRQAVDSQLRIEGLPPFEAPFPDTAAGDNYGATATATVAAMELMQQPEQQLQTQPWMTQQPQQQGMEQQQQQRQQQQQQQQQQQEYFMARARQEVESQLDIRSGPAAAAVGVAAPAAAAAVPPQAEAATVAPIATLASDGLLPPYGGPTTLPYDQAPPAPAFQASASSSSLPFSPVASSTQTPFAPSPQPPTSAQLYPMQSSGPAGDAVGFSPQGDVYGWDPRLQQQQQTSYLYDQQQPQDSSFQAVQREGFSYPQSSPVAAATMGGFTTEQPPEALSWYSMQQAQQQAASHPPFPPQETATTPTQAPTQVPSQKQQQRQLRFPFWPMPNLQAQAPPPPPPRTSAHPPSPPQQPMAAATGAEPRSAMAAGSSPQQPSQGFSPLSSTLTGPPTPTPQQPVRGAAPAVSVPPLTLPNEYRPRPLDGLSTNEMISEGLRLLRLGREETRKGEVGAFICLFAFLCVWLCVCVCVCREDLALDRKDGKDPVNPCGGRN